MAYSTQRDFLAINFFKFKYETKCSPLSKVAKLHNYCPITDYRSFSLYKDEKAKYIADLVACRTYVISTCDENATDRSGDTTDAPEVVINPLKILKKENEKLKSTVRCFIRTIEILECENKHLKTISRNPKIKIRFLSIFNKIQSLYEDAKISNDDQNELLILANRFCDEIRTLKDEIDRLKCGGIPTINTTIDNDRKLLNNNNQKGKSAAEKDDKNIQNIKKQEESSINKNIKQQEESSINKNIKQQEESSINKNIKQQKKGNGGGSGDANDNDSITSQRSEKLNALQNKICLLQKRAADADRLESQLECYQKQMNYIQKISQDQISQLSCENQKLKNHLKYADLEKKKNQILCSKLECVMEENDCLKRKMYEIDDLKDALINQFNCVVKSKLYNKKLIEQLGESSQGKIIQDLERQLSMCQHLNEKNETIVNGYEEQQKKLMDCLYNHLKQNNASE